MTRKPMTILPLATALGALLGSTGTATEASGAVQNGAPAAGAIEQTPMGSELTPNMVVSTGEKLLGFVTSERDDGTVVAQHASHVSHASHTSHHSHYSSR